MNEHRSDNADIVIYSGKLSEEVAFGVEKAALSLNSTYFREKFEGTQREIGLMLLENFTKDIKLKGLRIMSGMVDADDWSIE